MDTEMFHRRKVPFFVLSLNNLSALASMEGVLIFSYIKGESMMEVALVVQMT